MKKKKKEKKNSCGNYQQATIFSSMGIPGSNNKFDEQKSFFFFVSKL